MMGRCAYFSTEVVSMSYSEARAGEAGERLLAGDQFRAIFGRRCLLQLAVFNLTHAYLHSTLVLQY